jgi:hypothetical protein
VANVSVVIVASYNIIDSFLDRIEINKMIAFALHLVYEFVIVTVFPAALWMTLYDVSHRKFGFVPPPNRFRRFFEFTYYYFLPTPGFV